MEVSGCCKAKIKGGDKTKEIRGVIHWLHNPVCTKCNKDCKPIEK